MVWAAHTCFGLHTQCFGLQTHGLGCTHMFWAAHTIWVHGDKFVCWRITFSVYSGRSRGKDGSHRRAVAPEHKHRRTLELQMFNQPPTQPSPNIPQPAPSQSQPNKPQPGRPRPRPRLQPRPRPWPRPDPGPGSNPGLGPGPGPRPWPRLQPQLQPRRRPLPLSSWRCRENAVGYK